MLETLFAHTTGLQTVSTGLSDVTSQLSTKQETVVDDALEIRHVRFLQDSLDAKQSLQGDVPGTGVSLRHGAAKAESCRRTDTVVDRSTN